MARFCGNCGAELEDNAKVCGKCGTPLDRMLPGPDFLNNKNPERQKKVKRIVKFCVCLFIVLFAVSLIVHFVSNYTGNKGTVRKIMEAYKTYDIDTLVSLSSDVYYYAEDDYIEDYLRNKVSYDMEHYESSVGHSYNISYKLNEVYTLSDWKKEDILEQLKEVYEDFDVTKISDIAVADVLITAKRGKDSVDYILKITMTKEENSWRILYLE